MKLEFYVKHFYYPSLNSLTWTLDYEKLSDLDDSCGYWYVIPHPDDRLERTRVFYSVEVSMFAWVPRFIVELMSSKALTEATGWVKKFSELEYQKNNVLNIDLTNKLNVVHTEEHRGIIGILHYFRKRKRQMNVQSDVLRRNALKDEEKYLANNFKQK